MITYHYQAVDSAGVARAGEVDAEDRVSALELLHKRGLIPINVTDEQRSVGAFTRFRYSLNAAVSRDRIKLRELASLTYSLAALLKAGLTVDRALTIAASLEKRRESKTFFDELAKSVRSGMTFTEALTARRIAMPPYYINMVQAGEMGGTLPETLARVAELLQKQLDVRERIQSALVYPVLLAGVVIVTLIILLAFVLPRFQVLFAESEAPLPLSTRIVLSIGDFAGHYWWLMLVIVVIGFVSLTQFVRSPQGRERIDRWLLNDRWTFGLPAALNTARLLRTLSTLLQNAIPLSSALRVAEGTLSNSCLRRALAGVTQKVKAGEAFTAAFAAAGVFPNQAVQLARVGEETGRLEEMLREAATILESDSQRNLERLLSLLVPALTIAMGLIVAALIGSVLIGLLSINELAF